MGPTVAIIPARGGSKGLAGKNLAGVGGRSLVSISVGHALGSAHVDGVWVSTDDGAIAEEARRSGAGVIDRPAALSGDEASSESALAHALDVLGSEGVDPGLVVFLQATSPLRSPGEIDRAVETLRDAGADSLFSATRFEGFVWERLGGGRVRGEYDPARRPRRQEMAERVIENGSVYVFRPWVLRETGSRLGGRVAVHLMHPLDSFQVDDAGDLEVVRSLARVREESVSWGVKGREHVHG